MKNENAFKVALTFSEIFCIFGAPMILHLNNNNNNKEYFEN